VASGRAVRVLAALVAIGATLVLLAIPLWNVTRFDSSLCAQQKSPVCHPRTYARFAPLAFGVAVIGIAALMAVLVIVLVAGFRRVRALDAQERASRHPGS